MGKISKIAFSGSVIGLILAFSQPLYNLGILVFLGFVLIFLTIKLQGSPVKPDCHVKSRAFLLGYMAGLVYFLIDFKWFWAVYPLANLGIENKVLAFFFVFLTWIITAGAMAFAWGLAVWLFRQTDRRVSYSALLIFPSIFTLAEYARSFFIALVWTGRQTPIGPDWTIGNLAYNFHHSFFFLKFASWFGIYGVVFLIVFLSVLLFIFLEKRRYKKFLILVLSIFILFYWPFPQSYPHARLSLADGKVIEVAVIQTKTPSKPGYSSAEEASFFKIQLALLDQVSRELPETQLIVFPEESNFFSRLSIFKNAEKASRYFAKLFSHPVLIVDNSQIIELSRFNLGNSMFKARTIFLDTQKGIVGSYDKYLVTPGAEYAPLLFRKLDKILGINSPELRNIQEYETGAKRPEAVIINPLRNGVSKRVNDSGFKLNSLVCADIFSPRLASEGARTGSNLLITQSSFAFGHGPKDLLAKDLAASKFRAAESGRYLIKSSNFGYSFVISNTGEQIKTTSNFDPQILTASVVLKDGKTLYNKVGDTPILLGALMVVSVALFFTKVRPFLRPKVEP